MKAASARIAQARFGGDGIVSPASIARCGAGTRVRAAKAASAEEAEQRRSRHIRASLQSRLLLHLRLRQLYRRRAQIRVRQSANLRLELQREFPAEISRLSDIVLCISVERELAIQINPDLR